MTSNAMHTLRIRAEELIDSVPESIEDLSQEEILTMLQDLRVHEIELQIQNEELREAQLELLTAKESLQKSHDRFSHLFYQAPTGYVILDDNGMILDANDSFCAMLALHAENVVHHPFVNFINDDEQGHFRARFHSLWKNPESKRMEFRLVRYPNQFFHGLIEARKVDWGKGVSKGSFDNKPQAQLFITVSDISERITHERTLLEAKMQADRANTAKSMFLSSMTHELRTPLNAIIGFGELLSMNGGEGIPDTMSGYAKHIVDAGHHLKSMVDQVLDLAAIDNGRVRLNRSIVDGATLVEECLMLIDSSLAQKKGIAVNGYYPEETCFIDVDATKLKQAVLNLLSNAVKYNRDGGRIDVNMIHQNHRCRIEIADTGLGIAKEDQSKIFTPFERMSFANGQIEGTGIGLTITKQLIEAMDGEIGFTSVKDKGTTFWIELPCVKSI